MEDKAPVGCGKCVNGFDMLIYQGLASYEIWHETEIEDLKAIEIRDTLSEYFLKRR